MPGLGRSGGLSAAGLGAAVGAGGAALGCEGKEAVSVKLGEKDGWEVSSKRGKREETHHWSALLRLELHKLSNVRLKLLLLVAKLANLRRRQDSVLSQGGEGGKEGSPP